MAKRHGDPTRGVSVNVKKRKGIKVRTVNIPDSDDDAPPMKTDTEYARLLKTRVTTSGKVDSVTMDSLPLFEIEDHNLLEQTADYYEAAEAENTIPSVTAKKKRRKKANDSVSVAVLTTRLFDADNPPDQNANLARHTVYRAG